MTDNELIFEKYLNEASFMTRSTGVPTYGRGQSVISPEERDTKTQAKYDSDLQRDIQEGNYIKLSDVLGEKLTKKLVSDIGSGKNYLNPLGVEFGDDHFSLIPDFFLNNTINKVRLFLDGPSKQKVLGVLKSRYEKINQEELPAGNLPEYRSYKEYLERSSGKLRPAVLGGRSPKDEFKFLSMQGRPNDEVMEYLRKKYPEREFGLDDEGNLKEKNPTLRRELDKNLIPPEKAPVKKKTVKKKQEEKPKKKFSIQTFPSAPTRPKLVPASKKKKAKKKVAKESFIRDDIAF